MNGSWLILTLIALMGGGLTGWTLRAQTADHHYIEALAQRHEAEATYYLKMLDPQIQQSQGDIAASDPRGTKRRKTNGQ